MFTSINLDKHQSDKIQWPPRDHFEQQETCIMKSFEPVIPFYDIETVFKRVFG